MPGFIGTNFVKYILAAHGSDAVVSVVDSLTYAGNIANLDAEIASGAVNFVKADIRDAEAMTAIMADAGPTISSILPPRAMSTEASTTRQYSCRQTSWAHRRSLRPSAVTSPAAVRANADSLQVSTDEVYGALEKDRPEGMPLALSDAVSSVVSAPSRRDGVRHRSFYRNDPFKPALTLLGLKSLGRHARQGISRDIRAACTDYPLQ